MTDPDAFALLRSLPGDWGATEEELLPVEAAIGARLPDPLRELMRATGAPGHMHWLFPEGEIAPLDSLPALLATAREILNADPTSPRPTSPIIVLSQNQGYEFTFIRTDEHDPEVVTCGEAGGIRPCPGRQTIRQLITAAVRRATAGRESTPELFVNTEAIESGGLRH